MPPLYEGPCSRCLLGLQSSAYSPFPGSLLFFFFFISEVCKVLMLKETFGRKLVESLPNKEVCNNKVWHCNISSEDDNNMDIIGNW